MSVSAIIAILTFLLKSGPDIWRYIEQFIDLFGAPKTPTDAEMLAVRVAEYIRVGTAAWRAVWDLDYGAGEEGNVRAREAAVRAQIEDYARDWKNELLTDEQLETIIRTARGIACLGIGVPPTFKLRRQK